MRSRVKVLISTAVIFLSCCFLCIGFAALTTDLTLGGDLRFSQPILDKEEFRKELSNYPNLQILKFGNFDDPHFNDGTSEQIFGTMEWKNGKPVDLDRDRIRLFVHDEGTIAYVLVSGELSLMFPSDSESLFGTWYERVNGALTSNVHYAALSNLKTLEFRKYTRTEGEVTTTTKVVDTSKVDSMDRMFKDCSSLKSVDLSSFDTSSLKSMGSMFSGCTSLGSTEEQDEEPGEEQGENSGEEPGEETQNVAVDFTGFDTSKVRNMSSLFENCTSLSELNLPFDTRRNVDLDKPSNMSGMFSGCVGLESLTLSETFDTKLVSDMSYMFYNCKSLNNFDFLTRFNTSNVTSMQRMFSGIHKTDDSVLNLSSFNTGSVTNMSYMFGYSVVSKGITFPSGFGSPTSVANATNDMSSMFMGFYTDGELNLSNFDTTKVDNMNTMFSNIGYELGGESGIVPLPVSKFTMSLNLGGENFKTSGITGGGSSGKGMYYMFYDSPGLTDITFGENFKIENYGYCKIGSSWHQLDNMFYNCTGLTKLDLKSFVCTNVTGTSNMFNGCTNLTEIDLSGFNSIALTRDNTVNMFNGCHKLEKVDLSGFVGVRISQHLDKTFYNCKIQNLYLNNFHNGTNLEYNPVYNLRDLFDYRKSDEFLLDESLVTLNMEHFKGASVTDASNVFAGYPALREVNLSDFTGTNLTNVNGMFRGCAALTTVDLSSLVGNALKNANGMFFGCGQLSTLTLTDFEGKSVTNMSAMFDGCAALTELDLSKFDTGEVNDMSYMFNGCSGLTELKLGKTFQFKTNVNTDHFIQISESYTWKTTESGGSTKTFTTVDAIVEYQNKATDTVTYTRN